MTTTISLERMEAYKHHARRREAEQQRMLVQRREFAWALARRAAMLLKQQYGATRVVACGSLAHGAWFSSRSDIDLMAEGIPPEKFWRAWAALDPLSSDFEIDLIAGEAVASNMLAVIDREGVEL